MTQINVEFGQMNISAADPVQRHRVDRSDDAMSGPRVGSRLPAGHDQPGTTDARDEGERDGRVEADERLRQVEGRENLRRDPRLGPGRRYHRTCSSTRSPPAWELIQEAVEATGAYSNVDIGNVRAPDQASIHIVIKGLLPSNSGNMHIKTSPNWDPGTAIRYTNRELGYKGLYSIEVSPPRIRAVYDTILAISSSSPLTFRSGLRL